ncbi:MAG: AAA family ATPase [Hyphomonadaceae bacterium]|jgi:class 3 adenylate cyclase/tetratricopeptide (TPR) repeat protein|nr:AAA family ATPase [Hyphomonadaceae bacterium]
MTQSSVASPALSAERRQLTIMFCDLVGSTALAARLDPEDLRDVLTAYQAHATARVEAAGGRVARYQGDGILAYFGYPAAREDDAERAIVAGLEMARGIETGGEPDRLAVRVGIATGVVLVGDLLRSDVADNPPVTGETANLASRLQELAAPNAVVVCATTHRLAGALFEYRDLGLQRAKGLLQPIQTWQVVCRSEVASRFHALRSPQLPCVGRGAEVEVLLNRWAEAKAGNGGVVAVSGDPGIGKSRLAFELAARICRESPTTVLRYDCSPQHQNSMLYPVLEQLRRAARSKVGDETAVMLGVLRSFFADRSEQTSTAIALVAELMALPTSTSMQAADVDAKRRRAALFEAIVVNLRRLASEQPILLLIEDMHWIDPTSCELTELLVRHLRGWPILLVVTCRPEYEPTWLGEPHATTIALKPIEPRDARFLIRCIPGAERFPEGMVSDIAARADGIPLFIEELTKAVVESRPTTGGAGETVSRQGPVIPSSLHASLTARIDRLGKIREMMSVAAALGREFTFDLLLASLPQYTAETLHGALQRLVRAELLLPVSASAQIFVFRHALIQDAAYGMLLRNERKALHERIAIALQTRFPETAAAQPEIVAAHFTKAGRAEHAVRYWTEAGHRAVRGSALIDAGKHFAEAIKLVQALPSSPQRDRTELALHLVLGPATMATKGYAAAETLQIFTRARELAAPTSTNAEQLEILAGLFNIHYGRAEVQQAQAIARQYLALAPGSREAEARGNCFVGQTYLVQGAFNAARAYFEQTLAIYADNAEDTRKLGVYGSQYVVSTAFLAGVYWALGDPDKAAAATARSIAYAHKSGHLVSIALALITRLLTPIPGGLKGDPVEAEEALQFCIRHGLSNFEVWARFAQGAILVRRGDPRPGIEAMHAAIDAAERMGSRLFRPVQLATVASAHARLGEIDRALAQVDQAIAIAGRTGERRADSALHRLRGEMLIASGRNKEGEQELLAALEIARAQQAKSEAERTARAIAKLIGAPP